MEAQQVQKISTKEYIKKHYFLLAIIGVSLFSITLVTATALWLHVFNLEVTVKEPLTTSLSTTIEVEGYPGEEINATVSITNDATVEYDVCANLDEGVEFAVIENEFMVSPGTHDYIIVIGIPPETLSGTYNLNLTVSRGGC